MKRQWAGGGTEVVGHIFILTIGWSDFYVLARARAHYARTKGVYKIRRFCCPPAPTLGVGASASAAMSADGRRASKEPLRRWRLRWWRRMPRPDVRSGRVRVSGDGDGGQAGEQRAVKAMAVGVLQADAPPRRKEWARPR